ncbi:MAG: glycosyltransferase family 2 protein [Burkholderiales bacterium]
MKEGWVYNPLKTLFPRISISIVSHNQAGLVAELLSDIERHCKESVIEVILTFNLPEDLPFSIIGYAFPLRIIRNDLPLGFGANHNQAFNLAVGDYFCVLNPDIRIHENIFEPLIETLRENSRIGLIAPRITNESGKLEDSARRFPTPMEIVGKFLGRASRRSELSSLPVIFPDWVAGMFMLVPASVFREAGGFNTKYFLYYEDVDLCARLRLLGYEIALCQIVTAVHNAQRTSHRNVKYLRWHVTSMLRFFISDAYRKIRRR